MQLNLFASQPENVLTLFDKKLYHIPEYQRPYAWEVDKCETLWNDLTSNYNNPDDGYFLGIIVLIRSKDNKRVEFDVVDGQQRLISLSLLLRVLRRRDTESSELYRCLYLVDSRKSNILGNHIYSRVLGGDEQSQLTRCLDNASVESDFKETSDSFYEKNICFFNEKVKGLTDEEVPTFIDHLLNNVYILPVVSEDLDKALTIFETINNRGQDLTDSDIFKTLLYQLADAEKPNTKDDFVLRWNQLRQNVKSPNTKEDQVTFLFRCYMHLKRGRYNDLTNTVRLRSFFTDGRVFEKSKQLVIKNEYKLNCQSWNQTMTDLEHLKQAWGYLQTIENGEFQNLRYILQSFQNDIWIYPVVAFIYTKISKNEDMDLDDSDITACCRFMRNIARYLYSKGFDYASIVGKSIYDEMFQATICAVQNIEYCPNIQLSDSFVEKLKGNITVARFRRGFCAILEYLNQLDKINEKEIDACRNVFSRADVEHILPQQWENNYYDKWDSETVKAVMNTLGNLCLLESSKNIKGSNLFFQKKKEAYCNSCYTVARDLSKLEGNWVYETYAARHEKCVKKIIQFLTDASLIEL